MDKNNFDMNEYMAQPDSELVKKIKTAKTTEEVNELLNGMKLSDDQLEMVSGGWGCEDHCPEDTYLYLQK